MASLREIMDEFSDEDKKWIKRRTQELILEENTRQDLRKARANTQAHLAKELGVSQKDVSRIEKHADLLLSTLAGYVETMGGKLSLVAEFPNRPPMVVNGINGIDEEFQLYEPLSPMNEPPALDGDNPVKKE